MARKRNKKTVIKEYSTLEVREKNLQEELDKVKGKMKSLSAELEEIEKAELRENNDRIGETVYKIFGENISSDELKEKLEAILTINEAKEFIEAEKNSPSFTKEISKPIEIKRKAC